MALADFNDAVNSLSGLLKDNQKFGTYDSEVIRQVDYFYTRLFALEDVYMLGDWQIYEMPGSKELSRQLDLAVKKIVKAFDEMPVSDLKLVNKRSIFCPV